MIVLIVVIGVHGYLWWRLVGSVTRSRRWRLAGLVLLASLVATALLAFRTPTALPDWLAATVDRVGYLWIALMFYLVLILLVLEPVRLVARLVTRRNASGRVRATEEPAEAAFATEPPGEVSRSQSSAEEPVLAARALQTTRATETGATATETGATETTGVATVTGAAPASRPERPGADGLDGAVTPAAPTTGFNRRVFLSRALAVTAGVAAMGTVSYGTVEATRARVKRVPLTLPRLDPRLDGFRIALLSDIHLSDTLRRPFLAKVVSTVNTLDVGAVAIVGDLVDGSVDELGADAAALADLRSRHGTFFVTGNHEYYSGAEEWVEYLPTLGVRVLRNERLELTQNGATLDLAGVDDVNAADTDTPGHGTDLNAALDGRDRDRPVVLLAHQPVLWPDAVRHGVDLQLSGHTHGGQLWPFNYAVRLQQPIDAGHAVDGDSHLYVTRGVGHWGPPVRVGAPPEITVLQLHAPT